MRHAGEKSALRQVGPLKFEVLLLQRLLEMLSDGNIAQKDREDILALDLEFRDRGFGRKLGSVFAPAVDIAALAHAPGRIARGCKFNQMLMMRRRKSLRQKQIDRLPNDLLRRVAEDLLRTLVEQRNTLPLIDGDNRVVGNI